MTLDLAFPPVDADITRIYGRGLGDDGLLGVPVCGGYDCDGDGHRDFAFGQFQGDPLGRIGAGEVTVVFGDGTIGGSTDSAVAQAGILRVAGAQPRETAGSEVWMDDVTGDGLGDLLIARQNYSLIPQPPLLPRAGAGGLTILVGDAGWKIQAAALDYLDLGAPPAGLKLITFVGPSAYDRLGIWMRTGDITGDGIADILVGADEVDGTGEAITHNQGAAFVIRGGAHLMEAHNIVDLADFGEATFPDALKGHVARIDPPAGSGGFHFGATVQVADLDGNRRSEVLIAAALIRGGASVRLPGAPAGTGQASGGSTDGTLYIVWDENFPPDPWPENHRFVATNPPLGDATRIDGESVAEAFSEEIVGGLDYSGDGFPDLFVGDMLGNWLGRFNGGRGYLFYNAANLRGLDFDLDSPPEMVSVSSMAGPVSGAISSDTVLHGDFDGDGIGDLAIGNPHDTFSGRSEAGSVHVFYGQPGGWPGLVDLNPAFLPGPGTLRVALVQGANGSFGGNRGDTLCYSAAAGDFNGDGRPDLIVNEMAGDGFGGVPDDVGNLLVIDATSLLDPLEPSLDFSVAGPVDFGTVAVDSGTETKTISLTNSSAGAVAITSLELDGPREEDFEITSDSGETVLGIGESRTISVTYDPSVAGRSGAAVAIRTDVDAHPVAIGLAGRGVDDSLAAPEVSIRLLGSDAMLEMPSQFGTDYTLMRSVDLSGFVPLVTVSGTGQTLYFTDPGVLDTFAEVYYRVEAIRD